MNDSRGEDDPDLKRAVSELQAGVRVESNSRLVFERYYPWVRRFFTRLGYTPQDSEDLAQDALSQVFRQIGSFRQEGTFKSWVFGVAANRHRNERRRLHSDKRKAEEVSIDATSESGLRLYEPVSAGASPVRAAYEGERREALMRAINGLPPQMGRVLRLRVDQGLRYREIGLVLQISVETVKAHLFQARQRLRDELGEDFADWVE
ncbi:MAG TPA: RNA polymerase sigma factor [Thermoanaerobaculia bacterium]|nr:RNA polymerase sigma factor [Thermoanaerobaculia bacterium]